MVDILSFAYVSHTTWNDSYSSITVLLPLNMLCVYYPS